MTKSIAQIALEAGITPEQLNQCLAKIGEGLEPVGHMYKSRDRLGREVWSLGYPVQPILDSRPLYTAPHEAVIAAEQRFDERAFLKDMLAWAYSKIQHGTFSKMEDAMMADAIKLYLEHGVVS